VSKNIFDEEIGTVTLKLMEKVNQRKDIRLKSKFIMFIF
jgi:hypothetical protein